jgi:hypothetical protein
MAVIQTTIELDNDTDEDLSELGTWVEREISGYLFNVAIEQ